MGKTCANCGKGHQTGRTVAGHSKKSSPRKFRVNFQKYHGKWFCTSCLKRGKKAGRTN
ncbi:MAG: 50S ribosomal protein L28 [Patescibacteria group bacterium]